MNKWDSRWFQLVDLVSTWSNDPSSKVGAVIVPENSDIPVLGYNGFPRGVTDSLDRYNNRDLKLKLIVHAEENCILNALRNNINIKGGAIYVSFPPCHQCSKSIIQSGLKKIIYKKPNEEFLKRWSESIEISQIILNESGIKQIEV
jgi:dCMP deaminase